MILRIQHVALSSGRRAPKPLMRRRLRTKRSLPRVNMRPAACAAQHSCACARACARACASCRTVPPHCALAPPGRTHAHTPPPPPPFAGAHARPAPDATHHCAQARSSCACLAQRCRVSPVSQDRIQARSSHTASLNAAAPEGTSVSCRRDSAAHARAALLPLLHQVPLQLPPSHAGAIQPHTLAQRYRPFYVNCIREPFFTTLAYTGRCGHLHQPGTCDYKHAWPRWRTADSIVVRAGHCAAFLPPYRDGAGVLHRPQLDPVRMALRPQSTDHDVFLQARVCCTALGPARAPQLRASQRQSANALERAKLALADVLRHPVQLIEHRRQCVLRVLRQRVRI
jgi:hypothetical protein